MSLIELNPETKPAKRPEDCPVFVTPTGRAAIELSEVTVTVTGRTASNTPTRFHRETTCAVSTKPPRKINETTCGLKLDTTPNGVVTVTCSILGCEFGPESGDAVQRETVTLPPVSE